DRVVEVDGREVPQHDGEGDEPDPLIPRRREGGVADRGHLRRARLKRARRLRTVVEDPELDVDAMFDVEALLHGHELRHVVHVVDRGDRDLHRRLARGDRPGGQQAARDRQRRDRDPDYLAAIHGLLPAGPPPRRPRRRGRYAEPSDRYRDSVTQAFSTKTVPASSLLGQFPYVKTSSAV